MYDNYGMYGQQPQQMRYRRPGKQDILNWFRNITGTQELDLVDDSYDSCARHVCLGGNNIELLPKNTLPFNMGDGTSVTLEYYQCVKCGKVILNRNFM